MKKIVTISLAVFLIVSFLSLGIEAQEEPKWCPLCGMDLKMYWKTNHRLTLKDGTIVQTCSIHCAALVYKERAKEIVKWEVVDYESQKFIDAKKAHFLIGSKLPGTMTAVSKIAFLSLDDAKRYQKK